MLLSLLLAALAGSLWLGAALPWAYVAAARAVAGPWRLTLTTPVGRCYLRYTHQTSFARCYPMKVSP